MNKKILICILLLFFTMYSCRKIKQKLTGEKVFTEIVEVARENNLILNKSDYKIVFLERIYNSGGLTYNDIYGLKRKNFKYKSQYFKSNLNYYGFSQHSIRSYRDKVSEERFFSRLNWLIIDTGLTPYVLDEFIYDTSKGNNFKEIEKIFDSYGSWKIKFQWDRTAYLICVDRNSEQEFEDYSTIPQKKCEERNDIVDYKKYFYKERELDKIDWEEYMKTFDYYPVLEFDATGEGIGKKEVIEINKKIAPYFNKKLLHIHVKL